MSNRFGRLLKYELFDWGRSILWVFVFIVVSWILGLMLRFAFAFGWNDTTNFFMLFNIIMVRVFVFVMWITGIVAGSEVPGNVRKGIPRMESFISKMIGTIIFTVLIGPFMMLFNFILTVLPGGTVMADWGIGALVTHFLSYMAAFCVGFFIAILWQRIGWLPTLILIFGTVFLTGIIGFSAFSISSFEHEILDSVNVQVEDVTLANLGDFIQEVVDAAIEGDNNVIIMGMDGTGIRGVLISLGTILVFGTGAFLMTKKLPVKVH